MRNVILSGIVATVVLYGAQTSQAGTIDFEDVAVAPGSNLSFLADLNSGGYFFDTSENEHHLVNANVSYADSGSTFLVIHNVVGNNALTMSLIGGGTFRLNSAQLAEGFNHASGSFGDNATSILITGNIFGGGTISTTVILDGINDGPGGLADFQLATFWTGGGGPAWDNLTSVVFDGIGGNDSRMGIDNIIVNVPEPSSLALVGMGIFACAWRKLARKARPEQHTQKTSNARRWPGVFAYPASIWNSVNQRSWGKAIVNLETPHALDDPEEREKVLRRCEREAKPRRMGHRTNRSR